MFLRLAIVAVVALCVPAVTGCAALKKAEVPLTDLGACILTRSVKDYQVTPPMTPGAIVAEVAAYCQTDEQTVLQSLTSLKRASEKQGLTFLGK